MKSRICYKGFGPVGIYDFPGITVAPIAHTNPSVKEKMVARPRQISHLQRLHDAVKVIWIINTNLMLGRYVI